MELGIHQKPTNVTQHEMILGVSAGLEHSHEAVSSKFWGYEARRAYIGAFTISTLVPLTCDCGVIKASMLLIDPP